MNVFDEISERLKKEKITNILHGIFNENFVKNWLTDEIQIRLHEKGTDINNKLLITDVARKENSGYRYATRTIFSSKDKGDSFDGKKREGKRYDIVTLSDTKDFYNSFKIIAKKTFLEIKADFIKKNEAIPSMKSHIQANFKLSYNSKKDFEENILGWTDEEMKVFLNEILIKKIITKYIEIFTNV